MKRRLGAIEAGQKVQEKKVSKDKPTLRKRTDPNAGGTSTTTNGGGDGTSTNGGDTTTNNGDSTSSDDDRPVLKKRPD